MMVTRTVDGLMWRLRDLRQTLSAQLVGFQSEVEQTQGRALLGDWKAVVIGRMAGFRCDDIFMHVADLAREGI